jgi:hypothetical protein
MTTNEFDKKNKEYFAKIEAAAAAAVEKELLIKPYERFTIIGIKRLKNERGGETFKYFRLGDFGNYYGACVTAKTNARSGEWYKQYIFDNFGGYCVRINEAGEAIK